MDLTNPATRLYYKGYVKRCESHANGASTNGTVSVSKGTLKHWKSYWMVLKGKDLLFYKDHKHRKEPVKQLDVTNCSVESVLEVDQHTTFKIMNKAGEAFLIEADDEDDKEAWMEYLQEVGCESNDPDGLFGIDLEEIQEVNNEGIPLVVTICVEAIENNWIDTLGVYRISSTKTKMDALKDALVFGRYEEAKKSPFWEVSTISCLIKQWLRDLPNPLCTFELFYHFTDPPAPEFNYLKKLIELLPPLNKKVLRYILLHLQKVSNFSHENKMEPSNLGAIFGQSLLRPGPLQEFRALKQNSIVQFMIENAHILF